MGLAYRFVPDRVHDEWWELRRRLENWWKRPAYAKAGVTVCCCDLRHRTIDHIEDGDLAVMTDGGLYDVFNCIEAVQPDGSCHSQYEDVPE